MKRFLSFMIIIMMLAGLPGGMAFCAYAEDATPAPDDSTLMKGHINGRISVGEKHYRDEKQKRGAAKRLALPTKYRSDEEPWAEGIRVKDQGPFGLCWAFSVTTAAEYSYAKETYETDGKVSEISPAHLGFFLYNHVNDPLNNTSGDFTHLSDNYPGNWALAGGEQLVAMQHLASYSGMGLEENTPYDRAVSCYDSETDQWTDNEDVYNDRFAYDDYITQQECICFEGDPEDIEGTVQKAKELVLQYGAVSVGTCFSVLRFTEEPYIDEESFKYGTSFYNYLTDDSDHAVTIIGWDDEYPKEKFTHEKDAFGDPLTDMKWKVLKNDSGEPLSPEEARALTTPPGDGAWIIQNSWGDDIHENGFYYASYYCKDLLNSEYSAYDMQPADTYAYNFQYDGTAYNLDSTAVKEINTNTGAGAANIYQNNTGSPITLEAVGYTSFNQDARDYDITVYTGLTDPDDPVSGIPAGLVKETSTSMGCKTAQLEEPVVVGAGEYYAVVFSFLQDKTLFGIEKSEVDYPLIITARTEPHQSFYRPAKSTKWIDMKTYNACFRIKGLANAVPEMEEVSYTVAFMDGLGNTIETRLVPTGQSASAPEVPMRPGYRFAGWDRDFSNITMNTVVTARWTANQSGSAGGGSSDPGYSSTLIKPEHGKVKVTPSRADANETVTITATPEEGYEVDTVSVIDASGNEVAVAEAGQGVYTFNQPKSKVTVSVTFRELTPERLFTDVPEDAWYYDAVCHCFKKGYFQGKSDSIFDPKGTMTRAMFATVLYRSETQNDKETKADVRSLRYIREPDRSLFFGASSDIKLQSPVFNDVIPGQWYTDAVLWAYENKIIEGYGNGSFGTNDPVTREQIVTLLYRWATREDSPLGAGTIDSGRVSQGDPSILNQFVDAGKISSWAGDAFAWALQNGVIQGRGNNTLDPRGTATRAEVAQIIKNYDTK